MRHIAKKVMTLLRNPSRSMMLRPYFYGADDP